MKQISIQLDDETTEQMKQLAAKWGLAEQRHNTAVVTRAVQLVWMLEIGCNDTQLLQRFKHAQALVDA